MVWVEVGVVVLGPKHRQVLGYDVLGNPVSTRNGGAVVVSGLCKIRVVAWVTHMVAQGVVMVVEVALLLVYPWITPRGRVATGIGVDVVHVAVRPHVGNVGEFDVHTVQSMVY